MTRFDLLRELTQEITDNVEQNVRSQLSDLRRGQDIIIAGAILGIIWAVVIQLANLCYTRFWLKLELPYYIWLTMPFRGLVSVLIFFLVLWLAMSNQNKIDHIIDTDL